MSNAVINVLNCPYIYCNILILGPSHKASLIAQLVKNPPAMQESACNAGDLDSIPGIPWRRKWQPSPVILPGKSHGQRSLVAVVHGVARSQTRLSYFTLFFHFHALEKEMAIHSSVLAWRIPGTGEPGVLPPMGSHRVGHDWSDLAAAAAAVLLSLSLIFPIWSPSSVPN